ncbi:phosphate starvation-inducible protein PhoH/PhoH-like ATPase [Oceanobacillus limi]|uniref:Phosphate starvation-inducible protein PhoH/PhoH-like ATPase n=1 Tax=Oceanobacillus limi TaxID=930131 RepID=A0A1I0EBA9_9BACI|nr:PhoH family protein [Oceanobacillus limi]SET42454.1 phosphate starvation-inducible protein PhoH/PhoH-like ATPase [Oceanobacillus limi]
MPLPDGNLLHGFAPKLTDEQREYVDSIFDNQFTIVNAKAGTGKTTLAVACAHVIGKPLIYTFSPVEEGSIGYTPGTVEEKESKYTTPLLDALNEIGVDPRFAIKSENNPDIINDKAWITAKSHTFLRGSNIKDSTVIIDEGQNMTRGELKKVLTRIHDSSRVILIGHDGQIDLKKPEKSGFMPYLRHFESEPYVKVVHLTKNFRGELAQHADELSWR